MYGLRQHQDGRGCCLKIRKSAKCQPVVNRSSQADLIFYTHKESGDTECTLRVLSDDATIFLVCRRGHVVVNARVTSARTVHGSRMSPSLIHRQSRLSRLMSEALAASTW